MANTGLYQVFATKSSRSQGKVDGKWENFSEILTCSRHDENCIGRFVFLIKLSILVNKDQGGVMYGSGTVHYETFRNGSTTYFNSSRFFPETVRRDVFALYGFVRVADNFVDSVPQDADGFYEFVDGRLADGGC